MFKFQKWVKDSLEKVLNDTFQKQVVWFRNMANGKAPNGLDSLKKIENKCWKLLIIALLMMKEIMSNKLWLSSSIRNTEVDDILFTWFLGHSRQKREALANRPPYVEESDWIYLCDYFYSSEFKAISEWNKTNRSKQKPAHTAGTKSFLRHKADREVKEGRIVGPIELCHMTHFSGKKNAMVDDISAKNSRKMKEM